MKAHCKRCQCYVLVSEVPGTMTVVPCESECDFNPTFTFTQYLRYPDGTIKKEYTTNEGEA